MKPFADIDTGLPYVETDEYVEKLVARCSEEAMSKSKTRAFGGRRWICAAVSIAAVSLIALFIWKPVFNCSAVSPIDGFLSGLSEEEIQMISDWLIDEIPEYYK